MVRILSWPARSNASFNPFQALMCESLETLGDIRVDEFNPISAMYKKADVWHWHWPDGQFSGGTFQTLLRYSFLRALLTVSYLRGIPIVWTAHNVEAHESRHPVLEERFRRAFIARLRGIHFLSRESQRALVSRYPESAAKATVVTVHPDFGAVATPISRDEARAQLHILDETPIVGFVGTISRYKGVTELVEVFRSLGSVGSTSKLLIAGKPNDDLVTWVLALRDQENLLILDRQLTQNELTAAYCASDLIVLPYRRVTNSGSVLMALTLGVPVLVPDQPSMRELAAAAPSGSIRLFEPPLTVDQLAFHIADALKSTGGGWLPLTGFSWTQVAPEIEALYRQVLDNGART